MKRPTHLHMDWHRVVLVLIGVFLLVEIPFAFEKKWNLRNRIHQQLLDNQAELAGLQSENLQLRKEKESLYTSGEIEQLAREKLGLTKAGEIPVKIVTPLQAEPPKKKNEKKPADNVWEKFGRIWQKIKEEVSSQWLGKSGPS